MIAFVNRAWNAYVGNAVAVRDYRSALRGNKAIFIWGAYLSLLILICGLAYSGIVSQTEQSIASIQSQLTSFYYLVMSMLGAVVTLAAPALTASAVTIERQRRSLDLVFSAPVPPRYLLVGKLIAGFRYLVMLLVLALPVTAVCVVMGGATWTDVVGAFIILLSNGIVLMAIGLLVSSLSATTVSATISAYLATIVYVAVTSIFAVILAATSLRPFGGARTNEAMWTAALNPFSASMAAPTFTRIGSWEVPNWAFGLVFSLAISRLLLAGAGSALSPFGSTETKTLRIQGLIVAFLIAFLAAVPLSASMIPAMLGGGRTPTPGAPTSDYFLALLLGIAVSSLIFVIPNLVCFGKQDVGRKYRSDGLFSLKGILLGTPSGAWPYMMLLVVSLVGGVVVGTFYGLKRLPAGEFWSMCAWSVGYLTLWWGLGRYLSSFKLGLRGARTAVMAVMILLLAVPLPIIFMIMAASWSTNPGDTLAWRFHLLYPLSTDGAPFAWVYGLACGIVGGMMAWLGEANLKRIGR